MLSESKTLILASAFAALHLSAIAAGAQTLPDTSSSNAGRADTAVAAEESAVTSADVQGVQTDLENYKFQVQRDRELKTAQSTRALLVTGVVQGRGGWTEARAATGYHKHTAGEVATALVGFTGNLYRDYEEARNLTYALRFVAAPNGGAAPVSLLDATVGYSLLRSLAPDDQRLDIAFGQQQLPFGLEAQTTDEFKPVITNAQFVGALGLGARQIGLIARGDLFPRVDYGYNYRAPIVQYALGMVNGNGQNTTDDNDAKDLIGRLVLTVPSDYHSWVRQFAVGATYYKGWTNLSALKPGATPTAAATPVVVGLGDRLRTGVDVYYNHHPFGLNYEWVLGEDEANAPGATVSKRNSVIRKTRGQVLTLFYNFGEQFLRGYRAQGRYDDWWPKSLQPFVRVDRWDPDIRAENNELDVYTAGVNFFFAETSKLQFNYNTRVDNAKGTRLGDAQAQIQFGF
ncbi:MAG: hypothetical protein JWP91_3589 [Fibrobacteres bacterium]|nr:hypothetical protein [Fibrobacterota bacterium]